MAHTRCGSDGVERFSKSNSSVVTGGHSVDIEIRKSSTVNSCPSHVTNTLTSWSDYLKKSLMDTFTSRNTSSSCPNGSLFNGQKVGTSDSEVAVLTPATSIEVSETLMVPMDTKCNTSVSLEPPVVGDFQRLPSTPSAIIQVNAKTLNSKELSPLISSSLPQTTDSTPSGSPSSSSSLTAPVVVGAGRRRSSWQVGAEREVLSVSRFRDRQHVSPSRGHSRISLEDNNYEFRTKRTTALKLRNLTTNTVSYDSLHLKAPDAVSCENNACHGSIVSHAPLDGRLPGFPRPKAQLLSQAKDFLNQYYGSIKRLNTATHHKRWEEVVAEVEKRGTYELTATELVYGAKTAWRNSQRCIGRIQWSKLQVFDARFVTTAGGMFEAICTHIKYATNKGNIRSAITVFPQRTDGKHDYRIWNPQLISYAGYKQPDGSVVGDPLNLEFTEVCCKLGWKGKESRWDILPLVVSAGGHDPEYFEYPKDLILDVKIVHPSYDWFGDLDLRWYVVPAVSNMLFDVGGIEFPAAPFNGWYMVTEIGCRDLCDVKRFNILESVALRMGLDTNTLSSLWKDKAVVEVNLAVIYSFQKNNITIMDHHTAAESFMKHLENEMRLRGGCPADWVWIVPPMSGSITPVFHQEMLLYRLSPSYEYQEAAWKTHVWKKDRDKNTKDRHRSTRKFRFREIARAVKFTSKLFGKALSRRIKATILYATETGKSEGYAKVLGELFNRSFNAQVMAMSEYDVMNLEHETLVVVVTSTFGNGDPPENGEEFAKHLFAMKVSEIPSHENHKIRGQPKSFIKVNSQTEIRRSQSRESSVDHVSFGEFGPLSNVRFALFALGSSAYPNFCAFGYYVDNLLEELGGERLLDIECGDELCGQEQAFRRWAKLAFQTACDVFCVTDDCHSDISASLQDEISWTAEKVRLVELESNTEEENIIQGLNRLHNRSVVASKVISVTDLHQPYDDRHTILVKLDTLSQKELSFHPGDHLGVFPVNRLEIVEGILSRLTLYTDKMLEIQVLKEQHTANGMSKTWISHQRMPNCTIRTALWRYLDVTSPPAPQLLNIFASLATDEDEQDRLYELAADTKEYEEWKQHGYPTVLEVLEQFPSVVVEPSILLTQLPALQPRFYSISSSPRTHVEEIHLTIGVVQFVTKNGTGTKHYGVCSNYLAEAEVGSSVFCFIRSAASFRLPEDKRLPVIMVGPGTGIAPFRSFWQEHHVHMSSTDNRDRDVKRGNMTLYFGCRHPEMDFFRKETEEMVEKGVLTNVYTAISRQPGYRNRYVQDWLLENSEIVYEDIYVQCGHFYVCGDVLMAEDVGQMLRSILQKVGKMDADQAEAYVLTMRDQNRYHEDIFGATFRAAEYLSRHRQASNIKPRTKPL